MASATVIYVRIDAKLAIRVKAKAKREGLTLTAATESAYDLYLKSNGSGDTSPEETPEPQRKGA